MTRDQHPSTHPPLPPTTEDDRFSWLRLLRSRRVGISTFYRLLAEHGSAQNALSALPEIARAAGVAGYQLCPEGVIHKELKDARLTGAKLLCRGTSDYPRNLTDLTDAPPLLWTLGDIAMLRRPMVSLVGARNASSLGTRMAKALARDLGEAGYVVVSGLARGVDTAAHHAALDTGTIAVQAGGVDVMYPAENTCLAEQIAQKGLRLSEHPMGLNPQARHFPSRNRIISGLSNGVVVVEAAGKSGSLITARNALDQGREVLAVPGHPFDARAAGCNMLIRDGAALVRSAADILEAVAPMANQSSAKEPELPLPQTPLPTQPAQERSLKEVAALHNQILARLSPSPLAEDQLIRDLDTPARSVAPVLVDLELDGKIKRQPGGLLSLTS
ncbi:MAG: DNA-processing protein DprA [Paracoccaceae bacterium]